MAHARHGASRATRPTNHASGREWGAATVERRGWHGRADRCGTDPRGGSRSHTPAPPRCARHRRRRAGDRSAVMSAAESQHSIAVPLPWVERLAHELIEHGWIRLAERDLDEQLALLKAMARLLEHRQSAA